MLDTNILFSACFYPSENIGIVFKTLEKGFEIYIAKHALDELFKVTKRKKIDKEQEVNEFLKEIKYIPVSTPANIENIPNIRDEKDRPILAAAIANDLDYLITGDKDFLVLKDIVKKPKIFTMQEFIEKFSK